MQGTCRDTSRALPAALKLPLFLLLSSCVQVRQLHAQIANVCQVASEVEADADRLPQDWLFHVRCAIVCPLWQL